MRLGLSLASMHIGASDADATRFVVERAKAAAAAAGLSSLTIGDHHATGPLPYVQNVPMLGRILAEWDERPAGLLFLVPAWNPVLMAEQIGTLAAIAEGPFIVQTGLGNRHQTAAMGLTFDHLGDRLERNLTIAQMLLAGDRVTDPDMGVDDVGISPLPPRGLEWWIGASADAALDRAARLGDAWYADARVNADEVYAQRDGYLAACEKHGRTPRSIVRRDVFISDDDAHGVGVGRALIDAGYRGGWAADTVAFGGVDRVTEQLGAFAEMGIDEVVIRTMMGVEQSEAVRSIELAGDVAARLA